MATIEQVHNLEKAVSFKRILIATDLSVASLGAESWGVAFARHYHSEAYLVHAIAPEALQLAAVNRSAAQMEKTSAEAERYVNNLAFKLRSHQIVTHTRIQQQPAVDLISWVVENENIDLLILGTHGRAGLKKLALGSVAEELSRRVACPVLTIGRQVEQMVNSDLKFANILFATDFGRAAEPCMRYALALAEEHEARLTVLHTIPSMPLAENIPMAYCPGICVAADMTKWQAELRQLSGRRLRSLIPAGTSLAIEPNYVVMTGFLPETIMSVARERNVDLIVMGAHGAESPRLAAHDPGTVLHSVVAHAHCPVLTVTRGSRNRAS